MKVRAKPVAILTLLLFMTWQVLAIVHLVASPHVFCPEHGVVAHTDSEGAVSHESAPIGSSCRVLAVLTHAIPLAEDTPPPLVMDLPSICILCPMMLEGLVQRHGRELYRLSPSQSPPVT